jgi:hypothetical protein
MAMPMPQPNKEEYTLSLLLLMAKRLKATPKMPNNNPTIKGTKRK